MKKTLLAVAIALSTYGSPAFMSTASAAIEVSAEQQIDQAKTRFIDLINQQQTSFSMVLKQYFNDDFKITIGDFSTEDNISTLNWQISFSFSPMINELLPIELQDRHFVIPMQSTFSTTSEMLDRDQLAHITSKVVLNDDLIESLGIAEANKATFLKNIETVANHVTNSTDLLKDGIIKNQMTIKPISADDTNGKLSYGGLTLDSQFDQNQFNGIFYTGETTIKSEQLAGNFDGKRIDLKPFTVTYKTDQEGSYQAQTSAIDYAITEDEAPVISIRTDVIDASGKNIKFDSESKGFLGDQSTTLHNLNFKSYENNIDLVFKDVTLKTSTAKQSQKYNINYDLSATPTTNIAQLVGIPELNIESINASMMLSGISAQSFDMGYDQLQSSDELKPLIDDLNSGAKMTASFKINTDQGNVVNHSYIALAKGKTISEEDIDNLGNLNPSQLNDFIYDHIDVQSALVLPKAVVDATGSGMLIEAYAKDYIKIEKNNYIFNLNMKDGKVLINDQSLDF